MYFLFHRMKIYVVCRSFDTYKVVFTLYRNKCECASKVYVLSFQISKLQFWVRLNVFTDAIKIISKNKKKNIQRQIKVFVSGKQQQHKHTLLPKSFYYMYVYQSIKTLVILS